MGIKQVELVPVSSTGPTQLIPSGKAISTKVFQTSRSDATATLKAVLGGSVSLLQVTLYGSTVSNAVTTATMTIVVSNNSGVISTGVYDVKTNGATTGIVNMSALPNIEPIPANGDLKITAQYADTGGAATLGGPWNVRVDYV